MGKASKGRTAALLSLLLFTAQCAQCHDGSGTADASDEAARTLEQARDMAQGKEPLPTRPEALVLAQTMEARAAKEGAGAAAVELHVIAAGIFERVWRLEGKEQDAKEAATAYEAAARDLRLPGACAAGLRAARLAGDAAHDAQTTYAELYRLDRRLAGPGAEADAGADPNAACTGEVRASMAVLSAFRPAPRVLAAIDDVLAAQGAIAASADAAAPHGTAKVLRVEHWPGKDSARVVITLSEPATFRAGDEAGAGGRGARTFVELDGVDLGGAARASDGNGIVLHVAVEPTSTGTRVSLDLDGGQAYRHVFHLLEPYRIVVDVARHPPGMSASSRRQVQRVVLDPGHGGNDAGATGPTGVHEKDVTLDIAKRAAKGLAAVGLEAILTRDDDRYVTLEERTARANQVAGDLFVSIHCNAAENRTRHGIETYVLDTTKDDIAGRVAARENATTLAAGAELGSILASMRLADQATRSTRLAELLQKSALASLKGSYPDALDGGVHPAGFYVLVGARMPAVLFETSYISNPTEEGRLNSEDYKDRLVDAIVNAVRAYKEGR